MEVVQHELEAQPASDVASVNVANLVFVPSRKPLKKYLEYLRYELTLVNLAWLLPFYTGEHRKMLLMGAPLRNVSFKANSGELTAIIGDEMERREIIELMTGRKKSGSYDGSISLCGGGIDGQSYYYENTAFVQKKPLFIPGLTYMDMITYAAELRLDATVVNIRQRVDDIITVMNLHHCKHRRIVEYPAMRGELGCDLRRLSIAIEVVHLPPLIVIDEPCWDFEPAISVKVIECLKSLANRGHIVVCSMSKVSSPEFSMLDRVVLLTEGHSIYAGPPSKIEQHFCGDEMGYVRKKGVDLVDFTADVCSGVERPNNLRAPEPPSVMQEKFEASDLFEAPSREATNCHAFCPDFFHFFGYTANTHTLSTHVKRFLVVLRRAVVTKFKDKRSLQGYFMASFVLSSLVGYLQYGQATYGSYCLSLLGVPYANTTNVGSTMFFLSLFTQAFFFNDSNAYCQKLQLFRYEQASGCGNAPAFFLATAISEVPFGIGFAIVFSNIIYFMVQFYATQQDYGFYMTILIMSSLCGMSSAIMYCTIFKKELVVRDMFFFSLIVVVLLSGFPFSQQSMPDYMVQFSSIIPTRWVFEALYTWYFNNKVDGGTYLANYSYRAFDRSHVFEIQTNFLIVMNVITLFFLLPEPLFLRPIPLVEPRQNRTDRSSMQSNDSSYDGESHPPPRLSQRESEAVPPVVFMRESTVTGRTSKLSVNLSQMGEENTSRGPTVMLKDVTYRVRDISSPVGYKTVLNRISGQFDWGKLNMILGAPQCGKSSLMNIIAGNIGAGTEVGGVITFNGQEKKDVPLWERCGFVPMQNEHIRDLTVREVLTFAMKLRCYNHLGFAVLEDNVKVTIENLHLADVADKKVKYLNRGEYKRLSIAEEMVHGPKLLLMDEPTTGVSVYEASVLLSTFREMVNVDRTVVATMYQPSAEAFRLFDSLMLLSKGRVIYSGRLSNAADFFVNSPYQYFFGNYNNPADFLADISGGQISDCKGEFIDASLLENHYMQSENYKMLRSRMKALDRQKDRASGASAGLTLGAGAGTGLGIGGRNPMLMRGSAMNADTEKNSLSMQDPENIGIQMELELDHKANLQKASRPLPKLILAIISALREVFKKPRLQDFLDSLFKRRILLHRAYRALISRFELIIGSVVLHIILGLLFAWINKNITPASNIAYFGISAMFLIMANVQFIFFVYNNHHVFLKEYSRGLYSAYTNYTVFSIPMYLLKTVNATLFAVISWAIMDVDSSTETFGFIILCFIALVISGTMLSEVVIFLSADMRSSYITIPAMAFLEFVTSGLFLKSRSFPDWMSPWVCSASAIRWIMQACFICVYNGDTDTFPTIKDTSYTLYTGYLNLFGWGGKTKWYCFYMLLANIAVFRFLCLLSSAYSAFQAKGTHKAIAEEH